MERQEIGANTEVVKTDQLDAEIGGHLGRDKRVMRDDLHFKGQGAAGDFLANAAEPGQAEYLAAHLFTEKGLLVPLAGLHRGIGRRQLARQREQLRHGQFRDADAVGSWRVHDDNAATAGGFDVHVVHARTGAGDRAELRGGGNNVGGDLGGAAHDNGVGLRQVAFQLLGGSPRTGIHCPSLGAEEFDGGLGQVVSYNNEHVGESI